MEKTVVEIKDGMKYTTHYIDRPIRQGDSVGGAMGSLINGVETITEIVKYVYKTSEEPTIRQYPLTPEEVYDPNLKVCKTTNKNP